LFGAHEQYALSGAHEKGFLVWMNRMFCPELMKKTSFVQNS